MPSKPSENKKFKLNEYRKVGEIGGKWWNMRLKNTYEKYNAIEIHKKVSQIEWKPHKLSLKPSENKEFKRNEYRKLDEMNEKEWKMTLKNTYETYNVFKKSQKVSNPEENHTKCHQNNQKIRNSSEMSAENWVKWMKITLENSRMKHERKKKKNKKMTENEWSKWKLSKIAIKPVRKQEIQTKWA